MKRERDAEKKKFELEAEEELEVILMEGKLDLRWWKERLLQKQNTKAPSNKKIFKMKFKKEGIASITSKTISEIISPDQ